MKIDATRPVRVPAAAPAAGTQALEPRKAPEPRRAAEPRIAADQRVAPARPAAVPTEGVGRHWLEWVPAPLRWAGVGAVAALGRAVERAKALVTGPEKAPPIPADARGRALAAWDALGKKYEIPGLPGHYAETLGGVKPATVWPHGQAIAAALDVAELTGDWSKVDQTMAALSGYEAGNAYSPGLYTWHAKRLWDDNAWIGLDFLQAHAQTGNPDYLAKAEALFPFMKEGLHAQGGVYWEERNHRMTRNTCANAPAIQMALKLYQATGKPEYKAYAENLHQFMTKALRGPDGLYFDHLGDDGGLDKTVWSYNQGAAIGAEVLMYQVTKDPQALARAKQTADAALKHFAGDGFWKQPPSFNAIFFRNLLALDAIAPDPRYRAAMQAYVDRVWKDGRDPATGALTRGGIGQYQPYGVLDEAGFTQMNALLAWPKDRLPLVA